MADSAARQREFRKRMEAEGYVQVTGWVPRDQAADVRDVMKRLCEGDLEIGPLRSYSTGKLVKK